MKRLEYMSILRQKLVEGGLGNDEINDALEFYEELFLDAGYENEEKTAQDLGAPEKLAQQILAENGAVGFVRPEYKMDDAVDGTNTKETTNYDIAPDNRKRALIILVLCASIIWVPLLIGLSAGAFGIAVGVLAVIFSLCVAGVAVGVSGIVAAFQAPPVGVMLIGVGLFLSGLGFLIAKPVATGVFNLFKRFFKWLIDSIRRLFNSASSERAVSSNG